MSFIWEWFVCQIIYRISIEFSPDDVGYIIEGYMYVYIQKKLIQKGGTKLQST